MSTIKKSVNTSMLLQQTIVLGMRNHFSARDRSKKVMDSPYWSVSHLCRFLSAKARDAPGFRNGSSACLRFFLQGTGLKFGSFNRERYGIASSRGLAI